MIEPVIYNFSKRSEATGVQFMLVEPGFEQNEERAPRFMMHTFTPRRRRAPGDPAWS